MILTLDIHQLHCDKHQGGGRGRRRPGKVEAERQGRRPEEPREWKQQDAAAATESKDRRGRQGPTEGRAPRALVNRGWTWKIIVVYSVKMLTFYSKIQ